MGILLQNKDITEFPRYTEGPTMYQAQENALCFS
jgi:hypothetical protein